MSTPKKPRVPHIRADNDNFGCILNCAVRYAIGRQTYMPSVVIDFIIPFLPHVTKKTLYVLDQDITDQKYRGGYGDKNIDEPLWMRFHQMVIEEELRRCVEPYKDWRIEQDG